VLKKTVKANSSREIRIMEGCNMGAGKALSFLSIVLAILLPTVAIAQTPATPNGASPRAPAGLAQPAPAKPTAPISHAEAARPDQIGAEPEATTATYGDWIVRCQRTAAESGTQRLCDVGQIVLAQQNPILQLSIGPPTPKGPIKLTIVVPVNVSFPSVARALAASFRPLPFSSGDPSPKKNPCVLFGRQGLSLLVL
jgi:invasion protein IalB